MNRRKHNALTCCLGALTLSLQSVSPTVLAGERYVGGSAPHQRPAGAPVIRIFTASAEWRKAALTGVGEPIPASLKFLDHQGAWYTPFDQRGMHAPPAKTKP